MGRRRAPAESDPMDLLLDTVSNVFAGVMFLTLLAALLVISRGGSSLAESSNRTTPQDPREAVKQKDLQSQQQLLVQAIEKAKDRIDRIDPLGTIEKQSSYQRDLQQRLVDGQAQMKETQSQLSKLEEEAKSYAETQGERSESETILDAELQSKLVELSEAKGRTMRVVNFRPLMDRVGQEVFIMIRFGKVYMATNSALSNSLNENEVELRGTGIFPIREAGRRIESEADSDRVASLLNKKFPSDRYYIAIAVWDDSFATFQLIKTAMEAQGYQYRTLPANNDSVFTRGSVERPLVQ
jgi:hypothetical protein